MITNGGIFEPRCMPSGLYIENGKIIHPLNSNPGKGNFFLKPNGVFLIPKNSEASVLTTKKYHHQPKKKKDTVQLAVQSGQMLLIQEKVHPAFNEESQSKLHRNGVGVDSKGQVVFAITDHAQRSNLWTFAKLFAHLDCEDALFLDGDLSRMIVDPPKKIRGQGFTSVIAVVNPSRE